MSAHALAADGCGADEGAEDRSEPAQGCGWFPQADEWSYEDGALSDDEEGEEEGGC